jgi:hypothetical protein
MTPTPWLARLDELEALAEAATPGPWDAPSREAEYFADTIIMLADTYENYQNNCAFIAASRTAVPQLVAALREAMTALERVNAETQRGPLLTDGAIVMVRTALARITATLSGEVESP